MILSQAQIAALHAGELVDHTINVTPGHKRILDDGSEIVVRPFSRNRSYAVRLPDKKASCRVMVLSCVLDVPLQRWNLQLKIERVQQEPARLLKAGLVVQNDKLDKDDPRSFGYTDRPSEALSGEPEAIDSETLGRYSDQARERHKAFLDGLDSRPLLEQLAYELRRAEEVGVDAKHVHSALQRRIRALRRQIDQQQAA